MLYSVKQPANGQDGRIKGVELGYQAFSLRLAYNYRSKYLIGRHDDYPNDSTVIGQMPGCLKGYSRVDAYVSCGISPHLRVALEANNITGTVRRSYYGIDNMPMGTYADDRRYAIGLHMEL